MDWMLALTGVALLLLAGGLSDHDLALWPLLGAGLICLAVALGSGVVVTVITVGVGISLIAVLRSLEGRYDR